MNIYLTGASGTGKTTMANILSERLGMDEAPSVSRTSPYEMGTQAMQDYVLDGVMKQVTTMDNTIISRTPIDVFAYSSIHRLRLGLPHEAIRQFFAGDPVILYFPRYWETPDDGFRPTENQDIVDNIIVNMLYGRPKRPNLFRMPNYAPLDNSDCVIEWLYNKKLLVNTKD